MPGWWKRPRGRLVATLALAVPGAALSLFALNAASAHREAEFDRARLAVLRSLTEATQTKVARWAPEELGAAERAYRVALFSSRQARASLWPVADFSAAHGHLEQTRAAVRRAVDVAEELESEARQSAEGTLSLAAEIVGRSDTLIRKVAPSTERRRLAARARLALDQARGFYRDGNHRLALHRATEARVIAEGLERQVLAATVRYADPNQVRLWQRWKDETLRESRRSQSVAIVVSKADRRLTMYVGGRAIQTYTVDLSDNWIARKAHAGDEAIPEGRYRVAAKKTAPMTAYHKALLLDYPNEEDRRAFVAAKRAGTLPTASTIGGLIEIHGEGGRGTNWTRGCVALENRDIDRLFARTEVGTPVTILGADAPRDLNDLLGGPPGVGRGQP